MTFAAAAMLFLLPPPAAAPVNLDFRVSALSGATVPLTELRGAKLTVVAFIAAKCPISQAYQARLTHLYQEYSQKAGVGFVILNSNANESIAELQKLAVGFPIYKDFHNRVADALDAQTTPEVFVIDPAGRVRYRGAIDDATNDARVKVRGLRDAIEAVLAGRDPQVTELKAFGCVLKREKQNQ